ncbi:MAG: hypothetical protein KQH63_01130 [Desulfobulbaceae bacterium]|nr:hypothetical protein [Desulfobulbaceae bacterium]
MKAFKSLVFAGIFAGLSANLAYADDIEDVVLATENTVEVTGTLTGCAERLMTSETICEDNLCTVNLYADPMAAEEESCLDQTNEFYQEITLPEDTLATDFLVQLFSGVDENEEPVLKDFFEVFSEEICLDDCAAALEVCEEECAIDTTCTDECAEGDTACIEACAAQCSADCQAADEECTADCLEPQTTIICTPETLNLKSNGRWITCLVQSETIMAVEDVDVESILLNETIPAEKACMQEEDLLMLKFSRAALIESLLPGDEEVVFPMETELNVTGTLSDGSSFEATDSINVIFPQPKEKQVKAQKKVQTKAKKKGRK